MKPAVGEVPAERPDGGVPDPEDLPGALVDLQVEVALPVAGLDVGRARGACRAARAAPCPAARAGSTRHRQLAASRWSSPRPRRPTQSPRSSSSNASVALGPEHLRVDEELDRAGAVAQLAKVRPPWRRTGPACPRRGPFVRHASGARRGGRRGPGARGVGGPAVGVGVAAALLGRPQLGQSVLALVGLAPAGSTSRPSSFITSYCSNWRSSWGPVTTGAGLSVPAREGGRRRLAAPRRTTATTAVTTRVPCVSERVCRTMR